MKYKRSLVWLRRDLRLSDHRALSEASQQSEEVALVFVFDENILSKLKDKEDRRLTFIYDSLVELNCKLQEKGSELIVLHGKPQEAIPNLAKNLGVEAVFTNEDYEPYAKARDQKVAKSLEGSDIGFFSFKDQVVFSGSEILKSDGTPYQVFTPYMKAWLKTFRKEMAAECKVKTNVFMLAEKLVEFPSLPSLDYLGFAKTDILIPPGEEAAKKLLSGFKRKMANYHKDRDFPVKRGTSKLSVHLRFGTISIRKLLRDCVAIKGEGAKIWLSELIWREFYFMILDRFPHVEKKAFKKDYEGIEWPGKPEHFKAWCEGRTGYPIVDAAMKQLNQTGFMHNRLRMIVASFLVKDLLLDWRKGEKYFAEKLLDFDLAANNGGWQWSASTGCDAQPYFRIFNPYSQTQRFDPEGSFIKQWLPEASDPASDYPDPIVDHDVQRKKALLLFKRAKENS